MVDDFFDESSVFSGNGDTAVAYPGTLIFPTAVGSIYNGIVAYVLRYIGLQRHLCVVTHLSCFACAANATSVSFFAYFGLVFDPFTPTVSESVYLSRHNFSANRASAGFFAFFGATGLSFNGPSTCNVSERRYLAISRIVATRTSVVRYPADLGTSCGFTVVTHDVVSQSGDNGIG